MRKICDFASVAMRKYLHGIIRQMAEIYESEVWNYVVL